MNCEKKHEAEFYKAVLSLSDEKECKAFFEDISTIKELESMILRLNVAKLLKSGETFNEIVKKTGASTATISRVNRCLNYGKGYKAVLEKIL